MKKKRLAVVASDECVACGCCAKVCPLKAIAILRGTVAKVDAEKCVGCSTCAKECPASSIRMCEVGI